MKTMWAMLGALLLSILVLDLGMVYVTYHKISGTAEHALDAALVAGIKMEDASLGKMHIDEVTARLAAVEVFREDLNLDTGLENDIMKNTLITVTIYQDLNPDHPGSRPYLEGTVKTGVTAVSPRLFGQEGFPITVRKTRFHMSKYK
ncbi:MAG: hypothetical protein CVU89_11065 [Firmicutes bacterium HGW-Firmicutes-14]|nr:MAG: hypothetical protein CVU89_11065 [Firmicutes bacterium HGW-Firmicutes-14]